MSVFLKPAANLSSELSDIFPSSSAIFSAARRPRAMATYEPDIPVPSPAPNTLATEVAPHSSNLTTVPPRLSSYPNSHPSKRKSSTDGKKP